MATNQFSVNQVAVNSAGATELLSAQVGSTSIRLIATPKIKGQTIYIGPTNAVTAANGYPLPTGEEYQFNAETTVYAIVDNGTGTVDVLQMWNA